MLFLHLKSCKVLALEARQDLLPLQLLVAGASLLPSLLQTGKLFHGGDWMTPDFKLILGVSFALENGRVDGAENEVVLRARKVEEPEAVYVALILGGHRDLVMCQIYPACCGLELTLWIVDLKYPPVRKLNASPALTVRLPSSGFAHFQLPSWLSLI